MRARWIGALLLALCLTGCGWMDGSYVSVTPHQIGISQMGEASAQPISGYTQLRSALIRMVDEGSAKGLFTLENYPREIAMADAERAVEYVTAHYPVGAYAVESIEHAFGTNAISVDITYRHSPQEIAGIRTVRGTDGTREAVAAALDACEEKLVLQISGYRDTDFSAMVQDYGWRNPDRIVEIPIVTADTWPEWGDTRVVELLFVYRTDRETLRAMREEIQPVFSSAALYVSGQSSDWTKYSQLYTFLTERFDYQAAYTVTPAYSLLCRGIGDSQAFSQVYAAMCQRIGLEARSISGTRNGEKHWWNLVRIDGVWQHLDLTASAQFDPMVGGEMTGYEWDPEAYPETK